MEITLARQELSPCPSAEVELSSVTLWSSHASLQDVGLIQTDSLVSCIGPEQGLAPKRQLPSSTSWAALGKHCMKRVC